MVIVVNIKTVKTEANTLRVLTVFTIFNLFLARIGFLYIRAVYQIIDAGLKQVGYFVQNRQRDI